MTERKQHGDIREGRLQMHSWQTLAQFGKWKWKKPDSIWYGCFVLEIRIQILKRMEFYLYVNLEVLIIISYQWQPIFLTSNNIFLSSSKLLK